VSRARATRVFVSGIAQDVGCVEAHEAAVSAYERDHLERHAVGTLERARKSEALIPPGPVLLTAQRALFSGAATREKVDEVTPEAHVFPSPRSALQPSHLVAMCQRPPSAAG
jgi:hypothetical protein